MQSPLEVGTVIDGKYRVEGPIGAGGMGMVFLARHLQLRERVAIKVLKPDRTGRPALVERLLREARAAASIRNRHVVRVLDVGTLPDEQPFIVMEFLEGEDLATQLARGGPLSISDAVDHVLEACEALAEAHALGIVHRDLKPANLFLERRASGAVSVKVVDFGVARFLEGHADATTTDSGLTSSHAFVGSPAYISPEQLTTPEEVDTRADIWALGVILYEMLTGSQPFTAPTLALTCTKILQEPPPPLARTDVAPELARALQQALEKNPERRFATMRELGAALAPFGSALARASLAEIEAVAHRKPFSVEVALPSRHGDPASPTLTGSVLKARRPLPKVRARLAFAALGAAVLAGLVHAASRRAPQESIPSEPRVTTAVSALVTRPEAESPPPVAAPTPSIARGAAQAAQQPAVPVVTKPPSKPLPRVAIAPPRPSAAVPAEQPATAPSAAPEPPRDESDRLYEFRK